MRCSGYKCPESVHSALRFAGSRGNQANVANKVLIGGWAVDMKPQNCENGAPSAQLTLLCLYTALVLVFTLQCFIRDNFQFGLGARIMKGQSLAFNGSRLAAGLQVSQKKLH